MTYLSESNFDFQRKKVLLRIDTDVDLVKKGKKWVVDEDFRLSCALPTIRLLKEKGAKRIVLLGHLGRPQGKKAAHLSLRPVADWFRKKLGKCAFFEKDEDLKSEELVLRENLRFDSGEEENKEEFSKKLAALGEVFVSDAFGNSHRYHASIVGLAKALPSFLGLRTEGEIRTLNWLKDNAPRPLVFVLGGSKTDKISYLDFLSSWADHLLVGGKFPSLIKKEKKKMFLATLKKNGKDLDPQSTAEFKEFIKKAKTVVWAGPLGVYEEKENRGGTEEIARAIAQSQAFKIAGGGDTHRILSWFKLWSDFNFVSVGGGAMLQFLKEGSLPGIKTA